MTPAEQLAEMAANLRERVSTTYWDDAACETQIVEDYRAVLRWFQAEVNARAEAKMLKTHKLEGMHYASMNELMKELNIEPKREGE